MREIKINQNEANQRTDKFLLKYLNDAGRGFIYKMLRKKNITLNGKKSDGSEKLAVGDVIKIFMTEETIQKFQKNNSNTIRSNKRNIAIEKHIIYEDDHIILLNKPVGMLSQKSTPDDFSANEYLIDYMLEQNMISKKDLQTFKPSVCNRLDRNTSGLLIFGKTLPALQTIAEELKNRTSHKYYLCIVKGILSDKEKISGYLKKDEKTNKVEISSTKLIDSDYIETEYEPISSNQNYTLLKVLLITGKTHQIRAHLASIHHPIIGDTKYGDKKANEYFKKNYQLKSQLLHSYQLQFGSLKGSLDYLSNKTFYAEPGKKFNEILKGEQLNGNVE